MRPVPQRDFFKEQKEWSERKIKILRNYLEDFCKILGGTRPRHPVYYVDGFAGPGMYEDGSLGSPVVAAELALSLWQSPRGYEVRCINVELDHDLYRNLCDHTSDYPSWMVMNFKGPFQGHIAEILTIIGDDPTLFFLDPIGIKELTWTTLEPIYTREATTDAPTEALMNLNTRHAKRLAGSLGSSRKGAEARVARLSAVMGTNRWKTRWTQAKTREERTDALVDTYLEQLVDPQYFNFACSYPIRSLAQGTLKYHLVFATPHYRGLDVMNDVFYKAEEEFQHNLIISKTDPLQPPLLGLLESMAEEARLAKQRQLKQDMIDLVQSRGPMAFAQVRLGLYAKWFGRIRTGHLKQACRQLIEDGHLESDVATALEDTSTVSIGTRGSPFQH